MERPLEPVTGASCDPGVSVATVGREHALQRVWQGSTCGSTGSEKEETAVCCYLYQVNSQGPSQAVQFS